MRTSNPIFKEQTFQGNFQQILPKDETMTVEGTVNKSAILLAITFASAAFSWYWILQNPEMALPMIIGGAIGGLIVALVVYFKPTTAGITAPIYGVLEGLFVGGISVIFNQFVPGIVFQAVFLTFGVFACMLVAYRTGLIKATEKFKAGVMTATSSIALIYLISFVLRLFGVQVPYIHDSGWIGIIFSLIVVGIAALNLILDFDFIERNAGSRAPKYMEWVGAFGLLVTIVWLYIEILKLLLKLASRD